MVKCENCTFFITENEWSDVGECHAKAPQPLILANSFKFRRTGFMLEWPPTRSSSGCGEGKLRLK